jgi:hypothetical protein
LKNAVFTSMNKKILLLILLVVISKIAISQG